MIEFVWTYLVNVYCFVLSWWDAVPSYIQILIPLVLLFVRVRINFNLNVRR